MLFSKEDVAQAINTLFEPAWESVRAVPIVKIDFGNGKVVTRTLNGNIATYVCTPEGEVLDIMAGIYTPAQYLANLREFNLLARYVDQQGKDKRGESLKSYHEVQEKALKENGQAARLVGGFRDMSKMKVIEKPLLVLLRVPPPAAAQGRQGEKASPAEESPNLENPDDLANWKVLAEDTRVNETVRRREIHALLKESGLVHPEKITKPLYKDILHADLDDPYLGLGETLFANYPFAKEDRRSN
ncbi:MAG: hypothetical protein ACJ8FY_10350 [Gemmataceae bacterium]